MRPILRSLTVGLLTMLARGVLRRYQPTVIGITGSVGKSLTKEAIFTALSGSCSVRRSARNLNTEIGVPLAIIGVTDAPHTVLGWLRALRQGWRVRFGQLLYPEVLVLELAADKPGDIRHLAELTQPRVGVVTAVGPTHLQRFETVERVATEKAELVAGLQPDDFALLNADDARVRAMGERTTATVATFGFSKDAEIRATDVELAIRTGSLDGLQPDRPATLTAILHLEGKRYRLIAPGFVAPYQLLSYLAAIGVARAFEVSPETTLRRLETLAPLKGRMRLLAGAQGSLLLDDSYNASPLASEAALKLLADFPKAKRRIVAFGEMAELGAAADDAHRSVGAAAGKVADLFLVTGRGKQAYADGAVDAGLDPDRIMSFAQATDLGVWLRGQLRRGDVVLIKGSQVARMERAVAAVLLDPSRADELLVRQEAYWRRRA